MKTKPIIGVLPLWDIDRSSLWMLSGYLEGIRLAGGTPIILPFDLEDSEVEVDAPPTHNHGLFSPSGNQVLKFDRLYEFLHRSDSRVILVSQSDFEYAVYNADFNQIFKDAETLKSTTKVKCLIQILRDKFPDNWYDAVSRNCGIKKDSLKKINYERDTLKLFKRCLEGIPLT